jgi:hypothetical protein
VVHFEELDEFEAFEAFVQFESFFAFGFGHHNWPNSQRDA